MTSNFNHRLRKMKSSLNVCLCLKSVVRASMEANRVDKDGDVGLAHCVKHSKDSVELAVVCKLLLSHVCCLSCY